MLYECEVLTSWVRIDTGDGQPIYVPFAAQLNGIQNWEDATYAEKVPSRPNVLVIRCTVDDDQLARLKADTLNALLWCDQIGDTTQRRTFCTMADRDRFASLIDRVAGKSIGRDVVGGDVCDMALTVVAWRLKVWIRTLPSG